MTDSEYRELQGIRLALFATLLIGVGIGTVIGALLP